MVLSNTNDSPGYAIAREHVDKVLERLDRNRCSPRQFSIYGLQKAIGIPLTAEGIIKTRELAEKVLQDLKEEGRIISFEIRPRFVDGPEWAFFTIPKKPKKSGAKEPAEAASNVGIAGTSQ